ncbi:hypothetical protein KUTeg_020201 [Tegillarca granosa]|uniref:Uncharacterized protein n=1 Tax=Tegillarca granosa TaxID=220873 RepID=A0ABQ9E9U2_TEGGR|nr:hypothetical protein KUTeg_020201 [Tegillarca granosa]
MFKHLDQIVSKSTDFFLKKSLYTQCHKTHDVKRIFKKKINCQKFEVPSEKSQNILGLSYSLEIFQHHIMLYEVLFLSINCVQGFPDNDIFFSTWKEFHLLHITFVLNFQSS